MRPHSLWQLVFLLAEWRRRSSHAHTHTHVTTEQHHQHESGALLWLVGVCTAGKMFAELMRDRLSAHYAYANLERTYQRNACIERAQINQNISVRACIYDTRMPPSSPPPSICIRRARTQFRRPSAAKRRRLRRHCGRVCVCVV